MRISIIILLFLASCSLSNKIKNADYAIQLKKYSLAIDLLSKSFETENSKTKKAEIAFKIGSCYNEMGSFRNSLLWFKNSYTLEKSSRTLLSYAYALKKNEDYKEAMNAFAELSNESNSNSLYRKEANICKLAQEWKSSSNQKYRYQINKLEFSSSSNEYAAVFDSKGSIYFSSDRIGSTGKNKYDWSGQFYSDIYVVLDNNELSALDHFINTKNNEGTCSISSKQNAIYYTRCSNLGVGDYYCQIFKNILNESNNTEELLDLGGDISNTMHPAIHSSDSILIFSSDRKNGIGQFDLYSAKFRNGIWTDFENLGDQINSPGNEKFPVWNGDTLYFSSDELTGMGGLDIFKTWKTADNKWVNPQHLEYPINSGADDYSYSIDPKFVPKESLLQKAIFSSNRDFSNGDDIYEVFKIEKRIPPKAKARSQKILASFNFFKTSVYSKNMLNESLDSISILVNNETNPIFTGSKTKITLQLNPGEDFILQSGRRGYLNHTLKFKSPLFENMDRDTLIELEFNISLVPFEFNKEFLLENVYYDYDKSDIRLDAIPSLNKLYELLIANPRVNVLIASHTDCRGEENYNQKLSQARAESVVKYLVGKGIDSKKLSFKGFGETEPIINCECELCTEEEHQLNRRSSFKLIR